MQIGTDWQPISIQAGFIQIRQGHSVRLASSNDETDYIVIYKGELVMQNGGNYNIQAYPVEAEIGILPQAVGGGSGGGVTSYTQLTDLPEIDGVTVIGNKTIAEYGVDALTESEITDAWNRG